MDLKKVTIMAITEKAVLVSKKGYQKWLPLSQVDNIDKDEWQDGEYHEEILLTDKGSKWIPNKSWAKLKVIKK